MPWLSSLRSAVLAAMLALAPTITKAETATVAVAANFATTLEKLAQTFVEQSGHDIRIVVGSTGKLYTQIIHGAPFDIFLAADTVRPARLVDDGMARPEDRRTYAVGRLVLWSRSDAPSEDTLRSGTVTRLAIANPELAPYGTAAIEVLAHYGLTGPRAPALVMGENIAQATAMLVTGNVDHGLVPLSIRAHAAVDDAGHLWTIPAAAHAPIRQDGVLLKRGTQNPAAVAFFAYLTSDDSRAAIAADGYDQAPEE